MNEDGYPRIRPSQSRSPLLEVGQKRRGNEARRDAAPSGVRIGAAMRVTGSTPWIESRRTAPLQRRSFGMRHTPFQLPVKDHWAGSAWRIGAGI